MCLKKGKVIYAYQCIKAYIYTNI